MLGYLFQVYLPSSDFIGIPEGDNGGVGPVAPSPVQSQSLWCCYAWPVAFGSSGRRAFMVNQSGDVISTKNIAERYSSVNPPNFDAGFAKGSGRGMGSTMAANTSGQDDQMWLVVN